MASEQVAQTYIDALNAEKQILVRSNGKTAIHMVPDYALRLRAAEAIHDRWVGKPRQAVELSGSDTPVAVGLATIDGDLAEAAHNFLRHAYGRQSER